MKRDSLPNEYPELDFTKMHVYLLEGTRKLLGNTSEISSKKSKEYLEEMGVTKNLLMRNYCTIQSSKT